MQTISFSKNKSDQFYKELRSRVNEYFKTQGISRHGNANMIFKTVFMIALYLTPFILVLTVIESWWLSLIFWAISGLGMAGLGLSVMHDANHGAYSQNTKVNNAVSKVMYILGGSDVNWRIQHNVLHHTYTNVSSYDEDIDAPSFLLRFDPHKKRNRLHRYQHIYAWPLYGLMTMMWFISKDYAATIRYKKANLYETQGISLRKHWTLLILSKVLFGFIFLVLPIWLAPVSWYISVIGFVIMEFISGLTLALIFQPAHVIPDTTFPLPNNEGELEENWAVHQLMTTANFAPNAKFFSWFVGGLNFQIEHHLFPNICHVHYKKLSEIVSQTAKDYHLPYYSNRTFFQALRAHTKMLKQLGRA
jgi:linoleoyl-CoA desaturase